MNMEDKEFDLKQMEAETEEMLKTNILDGKSYEFKRTEGGFVSLSFEGVDYPRVDIVRMFPFNDPEHFISIRTPGEHSKEIGIIEDMKAMPAEMQKMLNEQLEIRYFTPKIKKVISVKDEYGYGYFDVVTDKGECRFAIRMGGSSVVHLSDKRKIIYDVDENRFEITDITKLSLSEQKKLDLFL